MAETEVRQAPTRVRTTVVTIRMAVWNWTTNRRANTRTMAAVVLNVESNALRTAGTFL